MGKKDRGSLGEKRGRVWEKEVLQQEEKRRWFRGVGGRTKDPALAGQTARGQRRLPVVQVVRAHVVPQVRGTVGHAEGRGAEEAGAEGACVGGGGLWEWGVSGLGG